MSEEDSPRSTHPAESSWGNSVTRLEPQRTPTGRFATFRSVQGVAPRLVEGLNYLDDLLPEVEELAEEPELVRVIATTSKERSVLERMYRALGKIIGAIPRNTGAAHTQRRLDMNMDKFRGTCLDGISVSVRESGMLERLFRLYNRGDPDFNALIAQYCQMRAVLLSRDPAFERLYPNMYLAFLDASLINNSALYDMTINRARTLPIARIAEMNTQTPENIYALLHNQLVTRATSSSEYDADGMERQTKRETGGNRRKSKRRRNKKSRRG
jgi:hypothetical protein